MLTHRGAPMNRWLRILSMAVAVGAFGVCAATAMNRPNSAALTGEEIQQDRPAAPFFAPIDPKSVVDPAKVRGADRQSVWDAVFTAEQVKRGEAAYREKCAECHKADLQGDSVAPALAGPMFHFRWDESPVGAWFVEVRGTMPQAAPGGLSDQLYVDILAYVLKENGFPAGKTELPASEAVLQRIFVDEVPMPK